MKIYLLIAVSFTLTLFTAGLLLNRFTGEEGALLAYRSRLACKNDDTWHEGNQYAGRVLMLFSCLLIGMVFFFFLNHYLITTIIYALCTGFVITLASVYLLTERHLRDLFFSDGKRKPKF